MTDLQAVHEKLDRILAELLALRAGRSLTPAQIGAVAALFEVFGTSAFTTSEAVQACQLHVGARPALRAALVALVGGIAPQRVGIALARIVELGGDAGLVRLSALRFERGRRLWCCETARR